MPEAVVPEVGVSTSQALAGRWLVRGARVAAVVVVASALVSGVVGGLLRSGVALPALADSAWPGRAVLSHAFLMICGFIGTVIGFERAVAVRERLAFVVPIASALAAMLTLAGVEYARWLMVLASFGFIAVNALVVTRQRAPHTELLLVSAFTWLVGNLLYAWAAQPAVVVPWWFAFLVLTIAAERLEMTRLMHRRRGASALLYAVVAAQLIGCAAFAISPVWGGWLYGLSLSALALWLSVFDIARRTIAASGLSRYMAVCLLLGYGWLGLAGAGWVAAAMGYATRDLALHALGLGFVFSMMLAHGPVILPALARVKLLFGWFFYVPLVVLHGSLVMRMLPGHFDFWILGLGAVGNALAIVLFAVTIVGSAVAWRFVHWTDPRDIRSA